MDHTAPDHMTIGISKRDGNGLNMYPLYKNTIHPRKDGARDKFENDVMTLKIDNKNKGPKSCERKDRNFVIELWIVLDIFVVSSQLINVGMCC